MSESLSENYANSFVEQFLPARFQGNAATSCRWS